MPVPDWAFNALGWSGVKRNFRYADMLYPDGRRHNQWGRNSSVPDVSRPETKLWFYFLGAMYIDLRIDAIHFGQPEIMNGNPSRPPTSRPGLSVLPPSRHRAMYRLYRFGCRVPRSDAPLRVNLQSLANPSPAT